MTYLLDSNAVIAFQKGDRGMEAFLRNLGREQAFISSVILHELYFGAFKSSRIEDNLRNIRDLPFQSFDFAGEDARLAARIRDDLRRRGMPIGPYDMLIAGQALARDLTLVTRNAREFARVEGLRVEDWER